MPSIAELKKQQAEIDRLMAKTRSEADGLSRAIAARRNELARLEKRLAVLEGGEPESPANKVGRPKKTRTAAKGRKRKTSKVPGQKELVTAILKDAGKPLSIPEIVTAMKAKGYPFKSKKPERGVGVLLYSSKDAFRTEGRGRFVAVG
jgi:hypothetical protein